MKTTKLTADRLFNFFTTALEVLSDDPELAESFDATGPCPAGETAEETAKRYRAVSARFLRASEELAAFVDEYDAELEAALELAMGNGLDQPTRSE